MTLQRLLGFVRKACDDYRMIAPGDRVAVGVSGGKDSLALLAALTAMRRFYPDSYEVEAVTVSLGLPGFELAAVREFCAKLGVGYTVAETQIGQVVFEARREKNPCSLCANMRRGALHNTAKGLGCNKVALGHNRDDVIHTFLLSLFYEGRVHTFSPVTYLDRQDLTVIRPLVYLPEADAASYAKAAHLPVVKSPCPADGHTKRADMRELVAELRERFPDLDQKLFHAVKGLDPPVEGPSRVTWETGRH